MGLTTKNMHFFLRRHKIEPKNSQVVQKGSIFPQIMGSHISMWPLDRTDIELDIFVITVVVMMV